MMVAGYDVKQSGQVRPTEKVKSERLETGDVVGHTGIRNVPGRWNNSTKAMRERDAQEGMLGRQRTEAVNEENSNKAVIMKGTKALVIQGSVGHCNNFGFFSE